MERCIRISLSEYIDPDQSQLFDHTGRNEIWREPFPPARTCDTARPASQTANDCHGGWSRLAAQVMVSCWGLGCSQGLALRVLSRGFQLEKLLLDLGHKNCVVSQT